MKAVMIEESQEKQLIDEAVRSDGHALDALFTHFRERLLATIRSQMSVVVAQRLDPEDIFQETFIRAQRSLKHFEWQGQNSFCRWLEGIATHLIQTAGRRQSLKKELHIQGDFQADQASPSKHMRRGERFDRLRRAIDSLSADYRTVLQLSRLDGLTVNQIAERMGRSPSAIKNLLLRATKQLRQAFGDTESLNLGGRQLGEGGGRDGP